MLARTSQLRCSMHGLSRQRASSGCLWQDASIHGDLAKLSLTEKIERIAASYPYDQAGPSQAQEVLRFASSAKNSNAINMAPTRTALLPAPFQVHHTWNRPTSTGADGGDPLGLCWRGRPRRGPTIKLRRIRMESMRGIVRLPRQSSRGADLRNVYTERRSSPPARMLSCRGRASACSLLRSVLEHTRMRPHAKRSREFFSAIPVTADAACASPHNPCDQRPMLRAARHSLLATAASKARP